jgi:hypothetical protein
MLLWLSKECVSCSLLSIGAKKKIKTKYCDYLLCVQSPFFHAFINNSRTIYGFFFFIPLVAKNKNKRNFCEYLHVLALVAFFFFPSILKMFFWSKRIAKGGYGIPQDIVFISSHNAKGQVLFLLMTVMFMDLLQVTIFWVFATIFFEMVLLNSIATLKGYCNACHFKYLVLKSEIFYFFGLLQSILFQGRRRGG